MQGVFPLVCLCLVISVAVQENVGSTTQKPTTRKNNQARKSKGKCVSATMVKQLFEMKDKLHSLEDSLQATRTELESTKSQLNDTKTELESQLNATKIELESTKSQLNAAKTELESQLNDKETELESQLSATKTDLESTKSQLSAAKTELENQLRAARVEAKSTKSQLSATRTDLENQLRATRVQAESIKSQLSAVKHGQGSSFIRWGRKSCPGSTALVYSGVAGGKYPNQKGSGTNPLCLTRKPQFDNTAKPPYYGLLYGAEYQDIPGLLNFDVPCSVCLARQSSTIMVPATLTCPPGWTPQYSGHLVSQYKDYSATEYVCLDGSPEDDSGGLRDNDGLMFYYVVTVCGSLPCPPYTDGKVLTCVVCSR